MTNRNKVKNWAITFPQSGDVSRQGFVDSMPLADAYVCVMETHIEGGVHLHLGITLKHGLSKSNLLKWVKNKWENDYKRIDIQAVRSIRQWTEYIMKEDPEPLVLEKVISRKKRIFKDLDTMYKANKIETVRVMFLEWVRARAETCRITKEWMDVML